MKKLLFLAALMTLAACTQNKAPKALVLYYSQTNTTKAVAEEIAAALGADIEAILPVVPYEGDIPAVAARCAKDAAEGKLPELKPFTVDVNAYDIIEDSLNLKTSEVKISGCGLNLHGSGCFILWRNAPGCSKIVFGCKAGPSWVDHYKSLKDTSVDHMDLGENRLVPVLGVIQHPLNRNIETILMAY